MGSELSVAEGLAYPIAMEGAEHVVAHLRALAAAVGVPQAPSPSHGPLVALVRTVVQQELLEHEQPENGVVCRHCCEFGTEPIRMLVGLYVQGVQVLLAPLFILAAFLKAATFDRHRDDPLPSFPDGCDLLAAPEASVFL